jgi:hypothetical protein
VYAPLIELEEINTKCRIQLTKTLAMRHNVRIVAGRGEETEDGCRGLAFFLAFDPWETSLKCPPGSARFFDAAEKNGLLSAEEAKQLSKTLIRHGAEMARVYNGVFSPFFSTSRIRTILDHVDDLDHLSESALAVGGSWADRLYETCPFPLQLDKHLEVQSFRSITIEGEVEFHSQSPWLAWVAALDAVCGGPWAGLKPEAIMQMVQSLEQRVVKPSLNALGSAEGVLGQRVTLPMFSRGLQGVVFGVFTDAPKDQMQPILTLLLQFGETLSDIYSDLRWKSFVDALEGDLDEDELAREIINVVSPIEKIIVSRNGRRAGYRIGTESVYWSGYEPIPSQQLDQKRSDNGFSVAGPDGAEIYIETLTNVSHLHPEFTRIRLENSLRKTFGSITTTTTVSGPTLSFAEIRQLRKDFEAYADDGKASLAKLRQYYVVKKIEKYWHSGTVKITNSEMKSYLEGRGRDAKNGYQVTSFASDFEKIFAGKVTATKTRNALSLVWSKTASADPGKSRNT